MFVKFAHLSDCHLGAWRNEILNQMGLNLGKVRFSSKVLKFPLVSTI
ncbi:hypothetical protein LCGC14_2247620 [marine sediment metagenome]|uniref:Calcineurin-like phosphoesterase domain-containing protein n=1 Tax=marine sediment metagenome TaxID=412755 RepID=A0A0F9D3A3_9ZZZZ